MWHDIVNGAVAIGCNSDTILMEKTTKKMTTEACGQRVVDSKLVI